MTDSDTGRGTVEAIHTAPESGAPVEEQSVVEAVADRGLRGDRYFADAGTFSQSVSDTPRDVTLVERETLASVERDYDIALSPGEHRRNVTVSGVALDHLVGRRFRVGGAVCEGVERCEPCSYLERSLEKRGIREAVVHRGGLRARIVESGTIAVGDAVASGEWSEAVGATRGGPRVRRRSQGDALAGAIESRPPGERPPQVVPRRYLVPLGGGQFLGGEVGAHGGGDGRSLFAVCVRGHAEGSHSGGSRSSHLSRVVATVFRPFSVG